MLKWMRRLRISLAVKCQLLFGSAVVLIIGAALLVPWRRMQQLTDQLNEKAADAVAQYVVAEHVAKFRSLRTNAATTAQAVESSAINDVSPAPGQLVAPHLMSVDAARSPARATRFEHAAMSRFLTDADRRVYDADYQLPDGSWGYRYAVALYAKQECMSCHAGTTAQALTAGRFPDMPVVDSPATQPATATAATASKKLKPRPQLLGLVSVDIESQISSNERLLNHVFMLLAGLVASTIAIITLYMIVTRLILQPVRVLQDAAERVAQGDLNIRSDISSGDEFQQFSETFNTMLVNLKNGADKLRAVNKSLDLRLGQLAETNVALYESNRLKSEFLANVSHELRTPLNSILGFADLLKDLSSNAPPPIDAKAARYVQNILSSANHLLTLINDLLDLAKIEAGRMEIRPEPLSLPDVFEGLVSLLKPLCEAKRITIETSVSPGVPIISTDPAKLQQVLYNFLSNAIKFSPAEQTIDLTARREIDTDRVRIEVTDRGPGIDPGQHEVIFEKFRQIDGSVTRQHGGSGLGLAISKELITLMNGSIGVRSTPGQGATFWITLPLKIEAGAQDVRNRLVLT